MNTSADTQDFAVVSSIIIERVENGFVVHDNAKEKQWVFTTVDQLGAGIAEIIGSRTDKKCSCQKPFAAPTVGELAKEYLKSKCSACGVVTHILTDLVAPGSPFDGNSGRFCAECEVKRRNVGWYTPSNYIDKQLVKDVETYEVPL